LADQLIDGQTAVENLADRLIYGFYLFKRRLKFWLIGCFFCRFIFRLLEHTAPIKKKLADRLIYGFYLFKRRLKFWLIGCFFCRFIFQLLVKYSLPAFQKYPSLPKRIYRLWYVTPNSGYGSELGDET